MNNPHLVSRTDRNSRLGVLSALPEEQTGLLEAIEGRQTSRHALRDYHVGTLSGQPVVCVLARLGKVAAATTATTLIERFGCTHLLFTGVAGGIGAGLKPGDIVVGSQLVQHDMDCSPLFPRYEVPLLGRARFDADPGLSQRLLDAAGGFLRDAGIRTTAPRAPQAVAGLIASGDEFVDSSERVTALRTAFPELLAVEMEGAAVAQVCHEYGLPFAVLRTLSDCADEAAPLDFTRFVREVAAPYSCGVIKRMLAPGPV